VATDTVTNGIRAGMMGARWHRMKAVGRLEITNAVARRTPGCAMTFATTKPPSIGGVYETIS
jgi:hypothetical protein